MDRTVIVTGGGTGIGRAIAERFAAAGDRVIITGRRREVLDKAADELEGNVEVRDFDASDPGQVEAFVVSLDGVDVLVNNAGGNTDFDGAEPGSLAEVADAWQRNLAANLISAVLVTTALGPKLGAGASVISIGSIAADKGAGAYGAAKAGIASWNIGLARELGPRGVTANVVSPGFIEATEFFRDALTDQRRQSLIDAALTGRAGVPDDIAAMVEFLASEGARQIAGQTFAVNGGEWPSR
ncbi:SDR family NAD(P)-dependent oxidoreductase [Enemella evansiae]|uniref:SDR family NAD(P)-dependent oxidoreductase n=1 Tax=Enemella evansiae TaxID=2016499 RepID=UPI000B95F8E8|nr:SDR family oxidoreductase [Enemella evansiae]OYO14049.1 3-oxoacyl-ACP reductase [Enemella evansiae]TDO89533.1 3-oxoacyl-[acyl-carrier protein] reductase [Enemella evansiae]